MRLIFGTLFILIVLLIDVNLSNKTKGIGIVCTKYETFQGSQKIIDSIQREKDSLLSIRKQITNK